MLRNMKDLENYKISATDGEIGHLKDFYFDDDAWVVRYFIVNAGSWLSDRKVLISPISVQRPDWLSRSLPVSISKDQVRHSPNIDTDKPVSRQNEELYLGYYGYPTFWGGGALWGAGMYPYEIVPGFAGYGVDWVGRDPELQASLEVERARHRDDDPHLRSCNAVLGYRIHASDGEIGHVEDFLVDDKTWAIRYLVVETGNWWSGHKVLVAPTWITGVHWADESVSIDLSREAIKNGPSYEAEMALDRDHERDLYRYYGRSDYWGGGSRLGA